jgi:hypothetical protein
MSKYFMLFLLVFFMSCEDKPPHRQAFYHWKTVFSPDETERQALAESHTQRLYIRYFDVVQDGDAYRPEATTLVRDSIPTGMQVVPVVFIVNDVLKVLPEDSIGRLSERICTRIEQINRQYRMNSVPEIQLDCDWNGSTREKYFCLLHFIKAAPLLNGRQLSVTLRLHQWKYSTTTGVPPADKVCLMCYNTGRLTTYGSHNSILDTEEVRAYLQYAHIYPLPMDIAFPLFSWGVCFNDRQYRGLINGLSKSDLYQPFFTEVESNLYRADTSITLLGSYIRKGEIIRIEEPSVSDIRKTAKILSEKMKNPEFIIWFHLNSIYLQKITSNELSEIANLFH